MTSRGAWAGSVLLVLAALLSGCGGGARGGADAHAADPPAKRQIIFSVGGYLHPFGGREACSGLYSVDVDGGSLRRLTGPLWDANAAEPLAPTLGADPGLVGFVAYDRSAAYIFTYDLRSGRIDTLASVAPLVFGDEGAATPIAWGPGDERLLTLSKHGDGLAVERVERDGSMTEVISGFVFFPSWTPDGRVAYSVEARDGRWTVWTADETGDNARVLAGNASQAIWSPDGQRVAFFRPGDPNPDGVQVWVGDASGGAPRRVASHVAHANRGVVWSPDSNRILFVRKTAGSYAGEEVDAGNLYVKDVRTLHERLLRRRAIPVAWLPGGHQFLYLRARIVGGDSVFLLYRAALSGHADRLLATIAEADVDSGSFPVVQSLPAPVIPVSPAAGGASARFEIRPFSFHCLAALKRLRNSLASR